MSDQPELPDAPEVPGGIVWARWIAHQLIGDPTLLRKNWRAILLGALVLSGVFYFWDKSRYETQIANLESADRIKDATIQSQATDAQIKSTAIAQMNEELKGTSPQLAAIQAGRDAIRKKLQEFYVEGGLLFNRPLRNPEDLARYQFDYDKYNSDMAAWISKNMGQPAADKVFDIGGGFAYTWDVNLNPAHSLIMNHLAAERRNLSTLIETAAWDGSPERPSDTQH